MEIQEQSEKGSREPSLALDRHPPEIARARKRSGYRVDSHAPEAEIPTLKDVQGGGLIETNAPEPLLATAQIVWVVSWLEH